MTRRLAHIGALVAVAAAATIAGVIIAGRGDDTFHALDDVSHIDPNVPQPPLRELAAELGAPPPFACIASGPRIEVLLVNPAASGTITADQVRNGMLAANIVVNAQAAPGGATLKVLCDSSGQIAVTPVQANASSDFGSVVNAVRAAGYSVANRRYVIVFNQAGGGGNGVGHLGSTDGAGPYYAVSFGSPSSYLMLHELTHTLSAVQGSEHLPGAPNSTWAGHCNDARSTMCYFDGGLRGTQRLVCVVEVWDCNGDDYANVAPPAGSWLAQHPEFNILACHPNGYVQVGACLPPPTTTTTTVPPPTTTVPPTTTKPPTTTTAPPPALQPPRNLRVTIKTCTGIGIAWDAVAGATQYRAQRRDGATSTWGVTVTVTNPRLNQSWSTNGPYDFRVRAVAGATLSDFSTLATTRAC